MKSSIPPNFRPLLRTLYTFVIAIAALWAMPRNAHAQMYVAQDFSNRLRLGFVAENNVTTGELIKGDFITPLNLPFDLRVSGNNLFVLTLNGTVGKYDATTGAVINANFIRLSRDPFSLALLGNNLFVVLAPNLATDRGLVAEYNATTGEVIKAKFIEARSGIEVTAIAVKSAK
jgi:hypothetical protein